MHINKLLGNARECKYQEYGFPYAIGSKRSFAVYETFLRRVVGCLMENINYIALYNNYKHGVRKYSRRRASKI